MSKPEKHGFPEGTRVVITGPSAHVFPEAPEDPIGKEGVVRINSYPRNDPSAWWSWVEVDGMELEFPGGFSLPFAGWFPRESIEEAG